jgi:hypothetical protein
MREARREGMGNALRVFLKIMRDPGDFILKIERRYIGPWLSG